jgi:glucosamine--fructose-6-phosphate aminotransferase (isomerizing)
VRIKLSELCYKSIACDVTEDKKHIDLSSEPLILVCAAGLVGGTADDVGKEVAIYRATRRRRSSSRRGRRAVRAAAAGADRCPRSTRARVRAVGDGRHLWGYEARSRSTRRRDRCARRAR